LFSVGLEPTIGFLHGPRRAKCPLVCDLQELYRWIVDTAVVSSLEGARRLLEALRVRFNSTVHFRGKLYIWDTIIRLKAQELADHILGKRHELSFDDPGPTLRRNDSEQARSLILSLSSAQARKLGIGKSTLHYLRKNAKGERSFTVYGKVRKRLGNLARANSSNTKPCELELGSSWCVNWVFQNIP
jgi:CRISPR-associated protein Cas1